MSQSFFEKLTNTIKANDSLLCIGLDPNPAKYPTAFPNGGDAASVLAWSKAIIEQTADLVCCYKPNIAFYEQLGGAGLDALQQTIAAVPSHIPVLLDAKRGDIGSTAEAYARAVFEMLGVDAVTVSPYLGSDSIDPFLAYPGKAVFVLCYTSNPSSTQLQTFSDGQTAVFEHVIEQGQQWGTPEQVGFVVGATQPQALARFRELNDQSWILAPGVGAQGGDIQAALEAGLNGQRQGLIVPVSRAIIYANNPRAAAANFRQQVNLARQGSQPPAKQSRYTTLINHLYDIGCVQFGDFTLASGKQSPVYIDLRRMSGSALLLKEAANAYADILRSLTFDHVAGVPYGALPVGVAVALKLNRSLVYPRKEAKIYGTARQVEGVFQPGDTAVVIEDVVTSGGSVIKAVDALEASGLTISDAVVLIDRDQGGKAKLADKGYQLHAVLSMPEIIDTLADSGHLSAAEVSKINTYLGAS